jgi:serine/threonine protein kinase
LLGRGGFAEVYLGEQVYLRTQAALKVLHVQLVEKQVHAFLQEARLLAHLYHPHIVPVLDFAVQDRVSPLSNRWQALYSLLTTSISFIVTLSRKICC